MRVAMTGGLSHLALRMVRRQAQWLGMAIKQAGPVGKQEEAN
jgi:hypothetical protein